MTYLPVLPHKNNANNDLAFDCAPRYQGKDLSGRQSNFQNAVSKLSQPQKGHGQYHDDKGNMHFFGEVINDDLNRNVKDEGYTGGLLFWHGDETHNPYSPGLDMDGDKPIFFIPNEPSRQVFTRTQLNNFYQEMKKKGYMPEGSPRF